MTISGIGALQDLVRDKMGAVPMPPVLTLSMDWLEKIHLHYRRFRFINLFRSSALVSNRAGYEAMMYSGGLQFLGEINPSIHTLTTLALVVQCAQELIRQMQGMYRTYQEGLNLLRDNPPLFIPQTIRGRLWWEIKYILPLQHSLLKRFYRLKACFRLILRLVGQIFHYTMTLYDARALIYRQEREEFRFQACTELVLQWQNNIDGWRSHHETLLRNLEKSSAFADSFLRRLGSPWRLSHNIQNLKQAYLTAGSNGLLATLRRTVSTVYIPGKVNPFAVDVSYSDNTVEPLYDKTVIHSKMSSVVPWSGETAAFESYLLTDRNTAPSWSFRHILKNFIQ